MLGRGRLSKRRNETRRGTSYRVSFTNDMGSRLEKIAGGHDLYAAALIREITERHIIDQERNTKGEIDPERINLQEKLREELVALNLEIGRMESKRQDMELRLREERIRSELGRDPFDDDLDTEPDDDDLE